MKEIKYPNLLAEMAKNGENQVALGKVLGISNGAVCRRINGKKEWTISEIEKICDHYKKDYYELFKEN